MKKFIITMMVTIMAFTTFGCGMTTTNEKEEKVSEYSNYWVCYRYDHDGNFDHCAIRDDAHNIIVDYISEETADKVLYKIWKINFSTWNNYEAIRGLV